MDELIERLQLKRDVWRGTEFGDDICELLDEAADALEAMRAEVEMLRDAFSDEDMTAGAHWFGRYVEQKRRAEQLAEEVEALRAEVERVTCELMDAITRVDKLAEALKTCLEVEERPSIIEMARDALRDHDQEEGNG